MVKPASGKSSPQRSPESSSHSQSQYKGVRKRKWGKWVSEIRLPNSRERIWLGSYDSPEKAARAFDAALFCLRGREARFNFPENPPEIINASSLTRSEIQTVAARFANGELTSVAECSERSGRPQSAIENHPPVSPPSPFSDGTVPAPSDPAMDWTFPDCVPDYVGFPGINEFTGQFLAPEAEVDYGDDTDGGVFFQPLWNF